MLLAVGLILIALAVVMIVIARPGRGVLAPFLSNWAVGQAYTLATLTSAVVGVSFVLNDWPL